MSNFDTEILAAVRNAVKEVYDIEPDEKVLMVETPRDPKMGDYSTSVAMRLAKKGELLTHDKDSAVLTLMSVSALIERNYKSVNPEMDLGKLVSAISESKRNIFPVVDKSGALVGVVYLDKVRKYIFRPELYHRYLVSNFMEEPPAVLLTTDTMKVVAAKFEETKAWNLPVEDENGTFVGFISKSGLLSSYRQILVSFTSD